MCLFNMATRENTRSQHALQAKSLHDKYIYGITVQACEHRRILLRCLKLVYTKTVDSIKRAR